MTAQTSQRQYNEVIAPHYDRDPQSVIRPALDRAAEQLRRQNLWETGARLRVLDPGVGTGLFLAALKALAGERLQPFGLDLSAKIFEIATHRIPDLVATVGDAADLANHFPPQQFDLICTHFLTGFVPMRVLAPAIWNRLETDGFWSLVGGTKAGFPVLQAKANGRLVRRLSGGRTFAVDDVVCNPAGRDEVVRTLQENGFAIRACETFEPSLTFRNLEQFMDFAYRGGWLTPFIEKVGLHEAGPMTRWLMNWLFPVKDHHSIEIVLAQKGTQ